jgi:hypothetical protein
MTMTTHEIWTIVVMGLSVIIITPLWVLFGLWLGKKYKGEKDNGR